jgi:hypothetical protein
MSKRSNAEPSSARHGAVSDVPLCSGAAQLFAFSHAVQNLAIACSRVAAVPFVTPRVAGNDRGDGPYPSHVWRRAEVPVFIDAPDDFAVGEPVIVFVLPLAGGARGVGAFEEWSLSERPGAYSSLSFQRTKSPSNDASYRCLISAIEHSISAWRMPHEPMFK